MILNMADIRATGSLEIDEKVNAVQYLGTPPNYAKYPVPLEVKAKAQLTEGDVYVSGNVKTRITYVCARCLETFEKSYDGEFSQTFSPDDEQFDLTEDIRETVLVDLPIKALCRKDCKGLCSQCGINQNKTKCSCKKSENGTLAAHLKDFPFKRS